MLIAKSHVDSLPAEPQRSKFRRMVPSPELLEYMRLTDATSQWLWRLPAELRAQYAGKWIAAKDCQIIAAADSLDELCNQLPDPDDPLVLMERIEEGVHIR